MHIMSVTDTLSKRKEMLQKIEEARIREQMSLIVLDPSASDRYSRAETRLERGMHKALAAFVGLRTNAVLPALSLPEPAGSGPVLDHDVKPETGGVN